MHFRILRPLPPSSSQHNLHHRLIPPSIKARTPARRDIDIPVRVHTVVELVGTLLARAVVAVLGTRLRLALAAVGVDVLAVAVLKVARVLARVGDLAAWVGRALGALLGSVALEGVLVEVALDVVASDVRGFDAADALAVRISRAGGTAWEHADVGCGGWANRGCRGYGVRSGAGGGADSGGGGRAALRRILGETIALATGAPCTYTATIVLNLLAP